MRNPMSLLLCLLTAFVLSSCGAKPQVPDPGPLPAGQSWSGVWYSTQFEHMYLRQTGDEIRGIYTYKYGGTMEGKANGKPKGRQQKERRHSLLKDRAVSPLVFTE